MKFMKFLDFYGKIMKIREIMNFSPLFRNCGHKYLSKVIEMLTNTIHFHSWMSRCQIFAKKAENAPFCAKNQKISYFHEFSIILTKIAILRFLRIPDLRGPRGAPGGAGRGPQGLPTRNLENQKSQETVTANHRITTSNVPIINKAVIY